MKVPNHRDIWSPSSFSVFRQVIGPSLLLCLCPFVINLLWFTFEHLDASLYLLVEFVMTNDLIIVVSRIFPIPNWESISFFLCFFAFELVLLLVLPGNEFNGPRAPSGHVPTYYENGFKAWILTMLSFYVFSVHLNFFSPSIIYNNLGPIMTLLNLVALLFCFLLYFKGKYWPSTADSGSSGNFFMDFYWGMELYPRIFGVHLKQFLICRFGMMLWCLFLGSFTFKTMEIHGNITNSQWTSAIILFTYLGKFFYWERWYLSAADIQVDRFGFMLCWGPMCFMPLVHTLQNLFLVTHPLPLNFPVSIFIVSLGTLMTFLNYDSDTQRHRVRTSGGTCMVWGRPARIIHAEYTTLDGRKHNSILLASGYHGIVRHFHYVPDIVNLFLYCVPCGFTHVLPYFYFFYLTALLVDRTRRIDERCQVKYGKYWEEYCKIVPFRLLPGVF